MTVKSALDKLGYDAILSIVKEIAQIIDMETWSGVKLEQLQQWYVCGALKEGTLWMH
jgi:hypothetical protein